MSRTERIAVKMNDGKKQLLESYADSMGLSVSALSAYIIGEWLHRQETMVKPMMNSIEEMVSDQLKLAMSEHEETRTK